VTLRIDPRDVAEIRVFHKEQFLGRTICAELAGATVPLGEIISSRNRRRRELRGIPRDRQTAVDVLLELKRGETVEKTKEKNAPKPVQPAPKQPTPVLKRYRNE